MNEPSRICFHCGEPVPPGVDAPVVVDGRIEPTCCIGCQAVARLIIGSGHDDYYRLRDGFAPFPQALELRGNDGDDGYDAMYRRFDEPLNQAGFVTQRDGVSEAVLLVDGIYCAACGWLIERTLAARPGVESVCVNPVTRRARLVFKPDTVPLSRLLGAIAALAYRPHPLLDAAANAAATTERRAALKRLAVAGFGMMQVMMFAIALYAGAYADMDPAMTAFLRAVSLLVATPVVFYAARPFFVAAWRGIRRLSPGMDVPVALAIGGAYAASVWTTLTGGPESGVYFDSVVMFTFFLSLGRYLEMIARHRAGAATEALARLRPTTAVVVTRDGTGADVETLTAIDNLSPGSRVRVRTGEAVPADGVIVAGRGHLDESLLTGESRPVPKQPGDAVTGGSVNVGSPLEIRIEATGEATMLSAIGRLLERAQTERPRFAMLADRLASRFVLAVLVSAGGVAAAWWQIDPSRAFEVTLAVLVATCPCALSLATPAAVTAATGALARAGLLVTRGRAIEALSAADTVVFDKTGTLTRGRFTLTRTLSYGDLPKARCVALAAALERHSEHPVAAAFAAERTADAATDVVVTPGAGIEGGVGGRRVRVGSAAFVGAPASAEKGTGATQVFLVVDDRLEARFDLEDPLRTGLADTVSALHAAGLGTAVLSGDAPGAVVTAADAAGIVSRHARQSPRDKLDRVRGLQRDGRRVAMVGDGINDAPVLAGADVSIATASGTNLAQTSADIVLLGPTLDALPLGFAHARRTRRVIRQNLSWAVGYNALALPLAATGHLTPWLAAIGMSLSSLVVVLNALRLARVDAGDRRRQAAAVDHGVDGHLPRSQPDPAT